MPPAEARQIRGIPGLGGDELIKTAAGTAIVEQTFQLGVWDSRDFPAKSSTIPRRSAGPPVECLPANCGWPGRWEKQSPLAIIARVSAAVFAGVMPLKNTAIAKADI